MIKLVDQCKKLTPGYEVIALYPDTTTFYPGAVMKVKNSDSQVTIQFESNKDECENEQYIHNISGDCVIPKIVAEQTVAYCGICEKPIKEKQSYIYAKYNSCLCIYSLDLICLTKYRSVLKSPHTLREVKNNYTHIKNLFVQSV